MWSSTRDFFQKVIPRVSRRSAAPPGPVVSSVMVSDVVDLREREQGLVLRESQR